MIFQPLTTPIVLWNKKKRTKKIFRKYWRLLYSFGWEWYSKRFDIQLTFRFALNDSVEESDAFGILEHFGHKCAFQKSHQRDLQIARLKITSLFTVFFIQISLKYSAPINYIDGDFKKIPKQTSNIWFFSLVF